MMPVPLDHALPGRRGSASGPGFGRAIVFLFACLLPPAGAAWATDLNCHGSSKTHGWACSRQSGDDPLAVGFGSSLSLRHSSYAGVVMNGALSSGISLVPRLLRFKAEFLGLGQALDWRVTRCRYTFSGTTMMNSLLPGSLRYSLAVDDNRPACGAFRAQKLDLAYDCSSLVGLSACRAVFKEDFAGWPGSPRSLSYSLVAGDSSFSYSQADLVQTFSIGLAFDGGNRLVVSSRLEDSRATGFKAQVRFPF
jgi:hypothetical protein